MKDIPEEIKNKIYKQALIYAIDENDHPPIEVNKNETQLWSKKDFTKGAEWYANNIAQEQLAAKDKEIGRLKGLIEKAFIHGWRDSHIGKHLSELLSDFKSENKI